VTTAGEPPCFLSETDLHFEVNVYLGLGTNIGDRARNLHEALRRIATVVQIEATSSVYETEPVGYADQPEFWNMVVRCSTDLPARQLMQELLAIEAAMGRERTFKNAPRIIDIDMLVYDDVVIADRDLAIPHPRMNERAFVLRPLLEIAPDLKDSQTHESYAAILQRKQLERAVIVGTLSDLVLQ
jgi:2-amino-4-hydroxy-6-hydroxymethyldihydropteridine diphosphokinase